MISFYIDDAVSRGKTLGVSLLSHNGRYHGGVVTSVLIGTNWNFLDPLHQHNTTRIVTTDLREVNLESFSWHF